MGGIGREVASGMRGGGGAEGRVSLAYRMVTRGVSAELWALGGGGWSGGSRGWWVGGASGWAAVSGARRGGDWVGGGLELLRGGLRGRAMGKGWGGWLWSEHGFGHGSMAWNRYRWTVRHTESEGGREMDLDRHIRRNPGAVKLAVSRPAQMMALAQQIEEALGVDPSAVGEAAAVSDVGRGNATVLAGVSAAQWQSLATAFEGDAVFERCKTVFAAGQVPVLTEE